jgi:endonuclease YncB( thermonuclease family)
MGSRATILLLCACAGSPGERPCTLESWQDGDTAHVVCEGRRDTVRLVGIDTPESGFDDSSRRRAAWQAELWAMPIEQVLRCGQLAGARAASLCAPGSAIELVGDARDRYDRRLATLRCEGRDVNRTLVDEGLAGDYPYPADPARPARCP